MYWKTMRKGAIGSKKKKRKFVGTEEKTKDIVSINTHRIASGIRQSICVSLRTTNPSQNE
jgi:hypothetical protein